MLHKTNFSLYCLREFGWKERLLKPFVENISFERFDSLLNLYESVINSKTKGVWKILKYFLKRSILYPSTREDEAIEKKLYYERGFFLCLPPENEEILRKINELKNTKE
jgi:hypothetical protein